MSQKSDHQFFERKYVTIMFTDIVGYTALMGSDEGKAYDVLRKNRAIHLDISAKYNGKLIKEMGDGMLLSFNLPSDAVRCGIEIQHACQKENIHLRIGIHMGEVLFENGDILGDGVNIASRIEHVAEPGSLYISASVYNDIKNKPEIETEYVGIKTLKNVDDPQKIYKVIVKQTDLQESGLKREHKSIPLNWKSIILVIMGLAVVILTIIYVIPEFSDDSRKEIEKSIAVLPFDNESEDESNIYFVNGMMEDIRNNLAKIGDLQVISKTSTEKYRNTNLNMSDIAKELDVNYVLEGTVYKAENKVRIFAQLIETKSDHHVWAETYQEDLDDVFTVQSEIAQAIANELYAVITPDELQIIEKIPTSSITAYDIFLQARDQHNRFLIDYKRQDALEEAIVLYNRALEYDSTFARAYTGLALAYWHKYYWDKYFEETFLDSVMTLTNIALSFDPQLDEAYLVRGMCYSNQIGGSDKAIRDYNKALKINPNFAQAYFEKSKIYAMEFYDYVEAIKNRHMAVKLDKSQLLPIYLRRLGDLYSNSGFNKLARQYYKEALILDNDSVTYLNSITYQLLSEDNIQAAFENAIKCYNMDSSRIEIVVPVILFSSIMGDNERSYTLSARLAELFKDYNMVTPNDWHRIGYAFWQMGETEKAKYYFDEQTKWCLESIKLNKWYGRMYAAHYDLACIIAFQGKTEEAFKYLNEIREKDFLSKWWIVQFEHEPFFRSIRNDDRFQDLIRDMRAKYQQEHDRVEQWLVSEGRYDP